MLSQQAVIDVHPARKHTEATQSDIIEDEHAVELTVEVLAGLDGPDRGQDPQVLFGIKSRQLCHGIHQ